jgi:hypothetical protein
MEVVPEPSLGKEKRTNLGRIRGCQRKLNIAAAGETKIG